MISLREMELTTGQLVGEMLDGATLEFSSLPRPITVPCTHSPIKKDLELMNRGGGLSPLTGVEACQFRVSAVEGVIDDATLRKGLKCTLCTGTGESFPMQLWAGGLLSGAALYQFELRDANYKA